MEELIKVDKEFSKERFKSYASNIFVQITLAEMSKELNKVRHFMSDELENKYQERIEYLDENNYIQIYDELNVANIDIISVDINEIRYLLNVKLLSKSMDYIIDSNTKKYVSGNNTQRTEKIYLLTFEKKVNSKIQNENRICPNCGANMDINKNGYCTYCGSTYNLEDFNWVLVDIKTVNK